jgi:hypothetical protein
MTGNEPTRAEVENFLAEMCGRGYIECVGVNEHGKLVDRATGKPLPPEPPAWAPPWAAS